MRLVATCVALATLGTCAAVAQSYVSADYNPEIAWNALHYSKTAYCPEAGIQTWSCGPSCDFHSQFEVQGVYFNSSLNSQGFSGYDPAQGNIVLAFRGTSNLRNWLTDLDFFKTNYTNQPSCGCAVHRGFLHEWNSYSSAALQDITALAMQYPNAPILVTGHSLGAAVSILAAMDVQSTVPNKVTVYNFGEPRVGDATFAQWATTRLAAGHQFRVTHKRDPVPHVPPMAFEFLHSPHELWYDNNGNSTWMDCQDSGSSEDPKCSDSILPIDVENHLLYLGICTECICDKAYLESKYGKETADSVVRQMQQSQQ